MTDQQFMVWTGQSTLWLLIIILAARPIHKYLKFKYLMKYRRQLGWMISGLSLAHFSYWVVYYLEFKTLLSQLSTLWLSAGLLSFSILMVLGITSNNYAIKKLGGSRWKKLHKWTYLLPLLSLVHAHYALRGINWELILYAIPMILLVSWRFKETLNLAIGISIALAGVYVAYSAVDTVDTTEIVEELEQTGEETFFIGSTEARLDAFGEIEYVCEKVIPESVSCGYPVYLDDGTRYDSSGQLPK